MEHPINAFKCFDRPLDLGRYGALPLAHARGARVRSLRGTLWITQEDDREDHIVNAGESFTVDRDGTTLVSAAHGTGTVVITRPAPRPCGALARWLDVTRDFLLRTGRTS